MLLVVTEKRWSEGARRRTVPAMHDRIIRARTWALFGALVTAYACAPTGPSPRLAARETTSTVADTPEAFFRAPARDPIQISPDGEHVAFIHAEGGPASLWVAPTRHTDGARRLSADPDGVRSFRWDASGTRLVYGVDHDGDERVRLRVVALDGGPARDLVAVPGASATLLGIGRTGDEAFVTLDDRDPEYADVHAVNLTTGARRLVYRNERRYSDFVFDATATLQLGIAPRAGGGAVVRRLAASDEPVWQIWDADDAATSRILEVDAAHDRAFVADAQSTDRTCLVEVRLSDGRRTLVSPERSSDVLDVLFASRDGSPLALSHRGARKEWIGLTDEAKADLAALGAIDGGELTIHSSTRDDRLWIVSFEDDAPRRYSLYDRVARHASPLFTEPARSAPVSTTTSRSVRSADGFDVVSYVTTPTAAAAAPRPTIFLVHGGPWMRDEFPPPPLARFLAAAGYATVRVNYRGSTGFGKRFSAAGNRAWGTGMLDDVRAVLQALVDDHTVDPRQIAVMGNSYGGYASLMLSSIPGSAFRCVVDVSGPTDLVAMIRAIPPEFDSQLEQAVVRVGDFRTEAGREALSRQSPSQHLDSIRGPLLVVQGRNDRLVGSAATRTFVEGLLHRGRAVTYVEFEHEGHQIRVDRDRLALASIVRRFFDTCFDARSRAPLSLFDASFSVPLDGGAVPGLAEAVAESSRGAP